MTSTNATAWTIDRVSVVVPVVEYIDLSYGNASTADIAAATSHDAGNNDNGAASPRWVFTTFTHTWLGTSSGAWNTGTNWQHGYVPNPTDSVILASGANNLDLGGLTAATRITDVQVTGTVAATSSGTLRVDGDLIFDGTAVIGSPANVTWEMHGPVATINSGIAASIGNLDIQPGAGNTISLAVNPLAATNIVVTSGTLNAGAFALTVTANVTGVGELVASSGTTTVGGNISVTN